MDVAGYSDKAARPKGATERKMVAGDGADKDREDEGQVLATSIMRAQSVGNSVTAFRASCMSGAVKRLLSCLRLQ